MDPTLSLDEFAHHASRYSINLNGLIEKDPTFNPVLGGQAKVYRGTIRYQMEDGPAPGNATTVPCETQVAIKTVRYLPQNQTAITRALQEVHLWSKLRHDNVLELLGIVTDFEETVSIISVWMPKGNAREYVQDRAVDPRPFVLDIAKGLEYLHAHKPGPIYHGDLKGANVLIARDGRALLTDFGFSYLSESSFSIALPDHMGGTLRYMAPERLDNSAPSAKGDVWAFGMTVLELFTAMDPFHCKNRTQELIVRIVRGPPNRPSGEVCCFRMTDEWWDTCMLCWAYDPLSRPNISEVVKIVQHILEKQLHSDEESIPSEETDVDSSCATLLDESNLYSAKEKDPYYRIPDDVGSLSMSSTLGERALHSRPRIPITPSEISPDDTVILFMGSTASGMSNFINKLTGMPEEPDAGSLASRTRNIEAYSYDHANGRFIFVDTPGFNSTDGALPDAVLNVVARWLEQCNREVQITGVIYTRRITDRRNTRSELNSFQTFSDWCGGETANRVRLVTTMWDELITEAEGCPVEEVLKDSLWRTLLGQGAEYERFDNTRHGAWNIVHGLRYEQKEPLLRERLMQRLPKKTFYASDNKTTRICGLEILGASMSWCI